MLRCLLLFATFLRGVVAPRPAIPWDKSPVESTRPHELAYFITGLGMAGELESHRRMGEY